MASTTGNSKAAGDSGKDSAYQTADKENLAYEVARLVCQRGWTANTIAKNLFEDEYESKEGKSRAIMRVKRALQLAIRRGILRLNPPTHEELRERLKERYHWINQFSVVHDEPDPFAPADDSPVFLVAARVISEEIQRLVTVKQGKGDIVIANAGGLTLSGIIRHLPTEAVIPEEAHRLRFVSLNGACRAENFEISANFLAVRMAEIYGGTHIASLPHAPKRIDEEYEQALKNIDLLISSAGTRNSFLFLWHRAGYEQDGENLIPETAVGDITFIPVEEQGNKVGLSRDFQEHVESELRPRPHYEDLLSLAHKGKVLVVCASLPRGLWEPGADYGPDAKARITKAILERGLASRCILGTSVAHGLFRLE